MKITKNMLLTEIDVLKPYAKYLMYKCIPVDKPAEEMSFEELNKNEPTWNINSMIRGLDRLANLAEKGQIIYDVYSTEECVDDPMKIDVKLWFMPAKEKVSDKPFIIVIAGGGYESVCSVAEAFPVAEQFNKWGYPVFVLNYRVSQEGLFPKPWEDLAAALKYIFSHKEDFGLCSEDYVVNGYSAGANLTALWGTESVGYKKYNIPKPKALIPVYAYISLQYMNDEIKELLSVRQFGKNHTLQDIEAYDIPKIMTDAYPPCYIVHAKDDSIVNYQNSVHLKHLLEERKISVQLELVETGGHGFGDGTGTDAEGWTLRAVHFLNELTDDVFENR